MFLLPSLLLGLAFAVVLGGKPSRILEVRFRLTWAVVLALGLQAMLVLFSSSVPELVQQELHLASYGLLIGFACANLHVRALLPVLLGMTLNAIAIAANLGQMPVSGTAADAVGLGAGENSNVSVAADRLRFLGDIFALPSPLPLANVFSIGDLLIGFGMVVFIVVVSLESGSGRAFDVGRVLAPLRVPNYRKLAAGKLISHIGDWLTLAALVGWIYEATESTTQAAAVMLIRLAPPILGGGVAALVVDRLPKQRLLVLIELGRGLVVAAALAGVVADERIVVFVTLGISGALAAVSAAAVPALLPSLLPAAQLPSANAGLGVAKDAAMAVGAVGAGVALSWVGAEAALVADVVTFAVAVLLYSGLRLGAGAVVEQPRAESAPSGFRYLLTRRRILVLVFSFCAATLATGLTSATLPRFLDGQIGLGAGGYGFGMAALGIGLALGQIVVGLTRVGPSAGRWIGVGLIVMSGLFVLLALAEHAGTALLFLAAIGFIDGTTDVLFETVVQREADPRYYGCVFGFAAAFITATMMGAVSVAPVANQFFDSRKVILGAGIFLVLAGVIALVGIRHPVSAAPPFEQSEPVEIESEDVPAVAFLQIAPLPPAEENVRVVLMLSHGRRIAVGTDLDRAEAEELARNVIRRLAALEKDEWPSFDGRFLRPDTIVSVELVEETPLPALVGETRLALAGEPPASLSRAGVGSR